VSDSLLLLFLFFLLQFFLVCLKAGVIWVDDTLDERKLLCGLCLALLHGEEGRKKSVTEPIPNDLPNAVTCTIMVCILWSVLVPRLRA